MLFFLEKEMEWTRPTSEGKNKDGAGLFPATDTEEAGCKEEKVRRAQPNPELHCVDFNMHL